MPEEIQNTHCNTIYFISCQPIESEENQNRIGIYKNNRANDRTNFFYNQAVSDILFHNKSVYHSPVEACVEKLERIAFVSITLTGGDVIKLEKYIKGSTLETLTLTGGLMSLYAGFSSLSLAEVLFWGVRYLGHLIWIPVYKAITMCNFDARRMGDA